MNYRLVIISHGGAETLERCLVSFVENVWPMPSSVYAHLDGPTDEAVERVTRMAHDLRPWNWTVEADERPLGFCGSVRKAWEDAVASDAEYVFWLEHDFVFARDVQLRQLAAALDEERMLAQMSLMRNAVNEQERAAGGLYESRPGQFRSHDGYLSQTAYFTTNPSLMRRAFMERNRWAVNPCECEGHFGILLRERGYRFGVWGDGSVWVEHIGTRSGFGY